MNDPTYVPDARSRARCTCTRVMVCPRCTPTSYARHARHRIDRAAVTAFSPSTGHQARHRLPIAVTR